MSFLELSMYIQCLEKKKQLKKKASLPHRFKEKYARETSNFFLFGLILQFISTVYLLLTFAGLFLH